jgi:hypothetical protein
MALIDIADQGRHNHNNEEQSGKRRQKPSTATIPK